MKRTLVKVGELKQEGGMLPCSTSAEKEGIGEHKIFPAFQMSVNETASVLQGLTLGLQINFGKQTKLQL